MVARRGAYTIVEHDLLDSPAFADLSGCAVRVVLQILRDIKAANQISNFEDFYSRDSAVLVPVPAVRPPGIHVNSWHKARPEVEAHGFAEFIRQSNGLSWLVAWSNSWRTWTPKRNDGQLTLRRIAADPHKKCGGTPTKIVGDPTQKCGGTPTKIVGDPTQKCGGTPTKIVGVPFLIQDFKTITTTTKTIEDEFGGGGGEIELDPKRVKKRASEILDGREWMTWAEAHDMAVKELTYKARLELGQFAGMTNARLATALRISLKELDTVLAANDPALVRSEAARMLKDAEEGRARSATALFRAQFCRKTPGRGSSDTAPDIAVG